MDELVITNFKSCDRNDGTRERITWKGLCERLASTKRTRETVTEYLSMDRDDQTTIKDVGGFVGGTFKGDRRSKHNIESRCLLTLDVDHGRIEDAWGNVVLLDVAACMYTTHKHTPENNRYRIVILLSRSVNAKEYTELSKNIAGVAGMGDFDSTTHQAERLMFYPSTSKDGVFKHDRTEGEALNVDEYLSEMRASNEAAKEKETATDSTDNDPADKGGVIGAFCTVYSIDEAITEFIPDVYTQGSKANLYTYVNGSTADGLRLYKAGKRNAWAHSFHESDPAGGKNVNAFDLVRIHKFGDTPGSFDEMLELALEVPEVKELVDEERSAEALEDYEEVDKKEDDSPNDIVEECLVRANDEYEEIDFLLERDGTGVFPRGDIQAIKGKAKSGKSTFLLTISAAILKGSFSGFTARSDGLSVLYADTEQNKRNTQYFVQRLQKLCDGDTSNFNAITLRDKDIKARRIIIIYAIMRFRPDILLIDGIRDLVSDFNDIAESSKIVEWLMKVTKEYDTAACVVLHENKADGNMRGHLGTETTNKCSEVYRVSNDKGIMNVEQTESRNAPVKDFAFMIGSDGLPSEWDIPRTADKRFDKIRGNMEYLFGLQKVYTPSQLIGAYMEIAVLKERAAKQHISDALRNGDIKKDKNGDYIPPDF